MTRFLTMVTLVVLGVACVGVVAPRIAIVLNALVPLVLVVGVVAAVLRVVWWRTGRW